MYSIRNTQLLCISDSIDGKHDDDSLSENVVVLIVFNKYYWKSHMSQSL